MVPLAILELAARETASLWRDRGLAPGSVRWRVSRAISRHLPCELPDRGAAGRDARDEAPAHLSARSRGTPSGLGRRARRAAAASTSRSARSSTTSRVFRVLLDALADSRLQRRRDHRATTATRTQLAATSRQCPSSSGTSLQSLLLPRCAVTVGHGGSGSMLAALTDGVPLLLRPARGRPVRERRTLSRQLGAAKLLMPDELTGDSVRACGRGAPRGTGLPRTRPRAWSRDRRDALYPTSSSRPSSRLTVQSGAQAVAAARSSRGRRRETICEMPSPPIVTP